MRRALMLGTALLAMGLAGCSDDDAPKTDAGVQDLAPGTDVGVQDLAPGIDAVTSDRGADQAALDGGSVADQQVDEDGGPAPDAGAQAAAILTATHSGWQVVNCAAAGCHSLPVNQEPYHLNATLANCADCHGGNGACIVPTNHNRNMPCGNCHSGAHTIQMPTPSACVSCHYAAAGTVSCP